MLKQKFVTFTLYLLMLTLGAAGIVTAFSGANSLKLQAENQADEDKAEAAPEESAEESLDYDWHEYGPFKVQQNANGDDVVVDRLHVYFKDQNDIFRGRITALKGVMEHKSMTGEELQVEFLLNNAVVAITSIQPDFTFEVHGLEPGPYEIRVLAGNSLYLASFVLSTRQDLLDRGIPEDVIDRVFLTERRREYQLEAAGCVTSDYSEVVRLLSEAYEYSKQADPPVKVPQYKKLHIPEDTNFDAAQGGTSYLRHTVRLDKNGVLHGQLRKPVDIKSIQQIAIKPIGDVEVYFLQNNEIVAEPYADEMGQFTVADLMPGNYSVVARSSYGVGVIGVRVIEYANAAAGLNLRKRAAADGGTGDNAADTEGPVGIADPQSSVLATRYASNVSVLLQPPEEFIPNLSLDMSLVTPFQLPVPPPQEQEDVIPVLGGGGGAGGGGGFFFPPFWVPGDDDVSNCVPAPPPLPPPPPELPEAA